MTRRDLAVWFCKVVAVAGLIITFFNVAARPSLLMPGPSQIFYLTQLISFPYYYFIWLFATGIGVELAAEGEQGNPIGSAKDLNGMLWRCIGFMLLVSGANYFVRLPLNALLGFAMGSFRQLGGTRSFSFYFAMMGPDMVALLIQCFIGFALAFSPRIRNALRSTQLA